MTKPNSTVRGSTAQLSQDDISRFLDTGCQTPQAKIAFGILAYCGCQVSQIPGLLREDIQLEANTIIFRGACNRKTGQTYQMPIHPKLKTILETYLPTSGFLFPDWHHGKDYLKRLHSLKSDACQRAGLHPFSIHVFRKTFLTKAIVSLANSLENMGDETLPRSQVILPITLIRYFGVRSHELLGLSLSD